MALTDMEIENQILREQVRKLTKKIEEMKSKEIYNSWKNNPDRSGGQYTEEEKNATGWY